MASQSEITNKADVMEVCAIMQSLGFSVGKLAYVENDGKLSREPAGAGGTTIVVTCETSGLQVQLQTRNTACSCPESEHQNSGIWQVSGVTGGKQTDKECGSTLLGSLSKEFREKLAEEIGKLLQNIREHVEENCKVDSVKENKSASMVELQSPVISNIAHVTVETPTRYRSLDTLTKKKERVEQPLPEPGPLQKHQVEYDTSVEDEKVGKAKRLQSMCQRQSTYTVASSSGSARRRNDTSSPIRTPHNNLLENLYEVEKMADELKNKLSSVIKDMMEVDKDDDSSTGSLAFDVSKISVIKGVEPSKFQYSSNPNLSALATQIDDLSNKRLSLKGFDSLTSSDILAKSGSCSKISKLQRLSPSIFKSRKDTPVVKDAKAKVQDGKSKLRNLLRPKIVTPVRTPKQTESNPNLSSTKKKFSHIKSTIPRPTPKKE